MPNAKRLRKSGGHAAGRTHEAKANKDWATSDKIRNELTALGFEIKDGKDGCEWKLNK